MMAKLLSNLLGCGGFLSGRLLCSSFLWCGGLLGSCWFLGGRCFLRFRFVSLWLSGGFWFGCCLLCWLGDGWFLCGFCNWLLDLRWASSCFRLLCDGLLGWRLLLLSSGLLWLARLWFT